MQAEQYKIEKEQFNKKFNIGYVDETLPSPDNNLIIKHYLSSVFIYGIILLIYQFNPFFLKHSLPVTRALIDAYYILYLLIAPFIYFIFRPKSIYRSHTIEICNYIKRVILRLPKLKNITPGDIKTELSYYAPNYLEGQSLMLIFIKTFFGALMIFWLTSNINLFIKYAPHINKILSEFALLGGFSAIGTIILKHREFLYSFFTTCVFSIDLLIFTFGYFTEMSILKNKIRTVETTPLGVFFCLACYPPFSEAANSFFGWNSKNSYENVDPLVIWTFRLVALFFITIYTLASVALFTKGSNLTNRGIVTIFPYNIVRHPAYISKNLFWIFTSIPVFFNLCPCLDLKTRLSQIILVSISLFAWALIYYFRALTEERHLAKDPDYKIYMEKVKYRFIPWVI